LRHLLLAGNDTVAEVCSVLSALWFLLSAVEGRRLN